MQKTLTFSLLLVVMAFVATACGLLQEPQEASGAIEAIPLAGETVELKEPEADPPLEEVSEEASKEATNDDALAADLQFYQIASSDSLVRFEIDEDLRGQRKTVVGTTDQVAGEIAVDLSDLSTAQIGIMQINARSLATDNNLRNRAIQNRILDTGVHEFITFTPTAIKDLPASTTIGEEVTFTVGGDLTIRDITQPAVFTVVATAVSEEQLVGTANTTVIRADFDLQIPRVPNVANVEEEIELYIDFVANRT